MRVRRLAPFALVVALLAPLSGTLAQGSSPWEHDVSLAAPGDATVEVISRADGLGNASFAYPTHWTDVEVLEGTHEPSERRVDPDASGRLALRYRAPLGLTGPGLALVERDRALLAPGRVSFVLPPGWHGVDAPVLALGAQPFTESVIAARRVVALGLTDEDRAYLQGALPYLAAVHGEEAAPLVVARDVMPRPFAAHGAAAVDVDAPVEALAEAVARAHQAYRVVEVSPRSASWLADGDARLHGMLSLVAAGLRSGADADELLTRGRAVADPDDTLPDAPVGSTLSRQKGLVVTRALDTAIRDASHGARALADLVSRLEAEPVDGTRLDSARVAELAHEVAGAPLSAFFDAFVYGPSWPETASLPDAPDLAIEPVSVEPSLAMPGESVNATFRVLNRGTRLADVELPVLLDGRAIQSAPVLLEVGQTTLLSAELSAHTPGAHEVALHHTATSFRVTTPARLEIARVNLTPDPPRAGEAAILLVYLVNQGEQPGEAMVDVVDAGRLVQRTTHARIDGGATRALTLPIVFAQPGAHDLVITLRADSGAQSVPHEVLVTGEAPRPVPGTGAAVLLVVLFVAWVTCRGRR